MRDRYRRINGASHTGVRHKYEGRSTGRPSKARDRKSQAAPFSAALTLSGVYGTERIRTPSASNTAFEIADGTTADAGSPAPHGRSVGRSISSMTMSGRNGKVRIG